MTNEMTIKRTFKALPLIAGAIVSAVVVLACAAGALVFIGIQLQNRALDNCTASPQHGSSVSVRWTGVLPPHYVCVWDANGRKVEEPAP